MNDNSYSYIKDVFSKNHIFKRTNCSILEENNEKTVYFFELSSGNGTMIVYHVFPGIDLIYNNFHAFDCDELHVDFNDESLIEINHCNKGRFECKFDDNTFLYLGEGDFSASFFCSDKIISDFPLGYYEGIQINLDKKIAQKSLNDFIGFNQFDLEYLSKKLRDNNGFLIIRAKEEIEHIISELYNVDERIKISYFKLKIVEFLLFLEIVELENEFDNHYHFSLNHVKIVKKIKEDLVDNIDLDLTLDELSNRYGISKTSIKNCFKAIYGKSLFQWRKEYRLQLASDLLKDTNDSISEIANKIGYKNHSKFASAFKSYFGTTPSEYKRLNCNN